MIKGNIKNNSHQIYAINMRKDSHKNVGSNIHFKDRVRMGEVIII